MANKKTKRSPAKKRASSKKVKPRAAKKKVTKKRRAKKVPVQREAPAKTKPKKVTKKVTKKRAKKRSSAKTKAVETKKVSSVGRKRAAKKKTAGVTKAVQPRSGFRSPEVEKLYEHFTKKSVRSEAMRCRDVKQCVSYIDELFDALDNVFAAWFSVREQAQAYSAEIGELVQAVANTEAELKEHRKQLDAAKKRDAIGVGDLKTLKSMLEDQGKLLRRLVGDVRGVAKEKRIPVPRAKTTVVATQGTLRGVFSPEGPGSGAGCSLAAARWGYSGREECAPYGYRAGEAGRRLANLRHHGVAFNPTDYFEMGREFERSTQSKTPKRRAAKRNASSRSERSTPVARETKNSDRSRASLFRRLGI